MVIKLILQAYFNDENGVFMPKHRDCDEIHQSDMIDNVEKQTWQD